ncbi:MAG: Cupredoxin-like domain [Frankiales bacterium]|nr:Cupredoxin-like domain [Frankiales bacterium]
MTLRLAAVLVAPLLLAGCGSSGGGGGGQASVSTVGAAGAQTATVGMNDNLTFVPTTVLAKVGTVTLTVDNLGRVPHNLVFGDQSLGKTGAIAGGSRQPLSLTFDRAGTFSFECTFHSGMTGKVVVS